jgi:hypothetical protein
MLVFVIEIELTLEAGGPKHAGGFHCYLFTRAVTSTQNLRPRDTGTSGKSVAVSNLYSPVRVGRKNRRRSLGRVLMIARRKVGLENR